MGYGSWNMEGRKKFPRKGWHLTFYGCTASCNGKWKEEAAKFLVSQYHTGHLSIDFLVGITRGIIHPIIGIPHEGTPIPKTLNSNDWI